MKPVDQMTVAELRAELIRMYADYDELRTAVLDVLGGRQQHSTMAAAIKRNMQPGYKP